MIRNFKEMGTPIVISQWSLFTENIWELAVSDLLMAASAMISLPLHKLYMRSNGILRWGKGGMALQTLFQGAWLAYWVGYCISEALPASSADLNRWPFVRTWTWTAQVFFTLHLLSLFMKMHSYAYVLSSPLSSPGSLIYNQILQWAPIRDASSSQRARQPRRQIPGGRSQISQL